MIFFIIFEGKSLVWLKRLIYNIIYFYYWCFNNDHRRHFIILPSNSLICTMNISIKGIRFKEIIVIILKRKHNPLYIDQIFYKVLRKFQHSCVTNLLLPLLLMLFRWCPDDYRDISEFLCVHSSRWSYFRLFYYSCDLTERPS